MKLMKSKLLIVLFPVLLAALAFSGCDLINASMDDFIKTNATILWGDSWQINTKGMIPRALSTANIIVDSSDTGVLILDVRVHNTEKVDYVVEYAIIEGEAPASIVVTKQSKTQVKVEITGTTAGKDFQAELKFSSPDKKRTYPSYDLPVIRVVPPDAVEGDDGEVTVDIPI